MREVLSFIDEKLKYISIFLMALSIITFLYFFMRGLLGIDELYPFGQNMVDKEIIIIPGLIYIKPVTFIVIIGYIGVITGLEYLSRDKGYRFEPYEYRLYEIIALTIFFISVYEIFFNFMLWGSLISSISYGGEVIGNIDLLANRFPNPSQSWNLVFATKIFYFLAISSATITLYIERWRRRSDK